MVPNNSAASEAVKIGEITSPLVMADKKLALIKAASSTPAGTRLTNKLRMNSSSPLGGYLINSTKAAICSALSGIGTMPSAARSSTCLR